MENISTVELVLFILFSLMVIFYIGVEIWFRNKSNPIKYYTEEEIVDLAYADLTSEDKEFLAGKTIHQMIEFHHSWGQDIRNKYNLWRQGNPYVVLDNAMHDNFPDQISMRVMEDVWRKV